MIKYFEILPTFIFTSLLWNPRGFYVKQDNYSVWYLIRYQTMILLFVDVMAKMRSVSQYKWFKLQGFNTEFIWVMQKVSEKGLSVSVQFNIISI